MIKAGLTSTRKRYIGNLALFSFVSPFFLSSHYPILDGMTMIMTMINDDGDGDNDDDHLKTKDGLKMIMIMIMIVIIIN